jgi:uncharacterized glyoxalase superfamily protein PhnB
MLKLAPTLIVEKVEPSVKFFTEKLGFEKEIDVPGEEGLVFAMLKKGEVEIHLQDRKSVAKDMPYLANCKTPSASFLYIDVVDVRTLYETLSDCEVIVPLEKTFYGALHFFIKEPGGHVIGFSQNSA